MSQIRPKQPHVRLDPKGYEQLCQEALQRDGWHCQSCGRRENLQIHHKQFRAQFGGDCEQNLITLCADCHNSIHQGRE
jgi:5-methylcytosine-specific restriction endonuclease McrA